MTLHVITLWADVARYIAAARRSAPEDWANLWWQQAIAPTWERWGAGQFNGERVRAHMAQPIRELDALAAELEALAATPVDEILQAAYARATALLPSPEPERTVCVAPLTPGETSVRCNMSGVVGECVGDSILLRVGAEPGWLAALPYHLTHEYHHTVWGYTYYYLQGHRDAPLLNSLINEGEADSLAHLCNPGVVVPWVNALTPAQEAEQWARLQLLLESEDPRLYERFFFGDAASDTPGSTGYTIGYHIMQRYLRAHPDEPVSTWTARAPREILTLSGYTGVA
jgi:hypothetical protein